MRIAECIKEGSDRLQSELHGHHFIAKLFQIGQTLGVVHGSNALRARSKFQVPGSKSERASRAFQVPSSKKLLIGSSWPLLLSVLGLRWNWASEFWL